MRATGSNVGTQVMVTEGTCVIGLCHGQPKGDNLL